MPIECAPVGRPLLPFGCCILTCVVVVVNGLIEHCVVVVVVMALSRQ